MDSSTDSVHMPETNPGRDGHTGHAPRGDRHVTGDQLVLDHLMVSIAALGVRRFRADRKCSARYYARVYSL